MKFEEKLIQLRKSRGMSQEDLAEHLDVSRQAVSRWEQGSTLPDIPNLRKLCDLFQVSADELIRDEDMVAFTVSAAHATP
jgi:transcriptional regulator with XRE-family HTH domain